METYQKRNEVLFYLSKAWFKYCINFEHGKNYKEVLYHIQQAQKAVFEEEENTD